MLFIGLALGLYFGARLYRASLVKNPRKLADIYNEAKRKQIERDVRLEMEKAIQAEMDARMGVE